MLGWVRFLGRHGLRGRQALGARATCAYGPGPDMNPVFKARDGNVDWRTTLYISRLGKLILNVCTIVSMALGLAGALGVLVLLVLLRLPSTHRLVDLSGCLIAAGLSGLATLGLMDFLTVARR